MENKNKSKPKQQEKKSSCCSPKMSKQANPKACNNQDKKGQPKKK